MIRQVKIEKRGNTWFVFYVSRKKFGRYSAAQFYASDHTFDDVVKYVKNRPWLDLVNQHLNGKAGKD